MKIFSFVTMFLLMFSATAQTFKPLVAKTTKFKVSTSKEYSNPRYKPSLCQVQLTLNEEKVIEFRMGVIGSEVSYFGWEMNIPVADLPLKSDYKRIFKEPGKSGMILTYNGSELKFEWDKSTGLWNILYPFTLTIDPLLTAPKRLLATVEGWEQTIFGTPKKHIVETCAF